MNEKEKSFDKENIIFYVKKMTKKSIAENQISRNELSKKKSLQEKGITLIALVVTIIILLILAGVTLNMALSQNGLFSKTQEAADKYKQAQSDEELEIEKIEYAAEGKDITKIEKISDAEEFKNFRERVNQGDNFENTLIKLSSDLDLGNEDWTPIGTADHPFTGVFNGNGYEIKNLSFGESSDKESLGLFGYNEGIIKNVGIAEGNISCKLTNENADIGFIAGKNSGIIERCYNKESGTITGGNYFGGIVGFFEKSGNVSKCYNEGDLKFYPSYTCASACGIVGGVRNNLTISLCYNKGDITVYETCHNPRACGITDNYVKVQSCYNFGDIIATDKGLENKYENADWPVAAGIVGQLDNSNLSEISNCYNIGEVKIDSRSVHLNRRGGIIGGYVTNNPKVMNNHFWINDGLKGIGDDSLKAENYNGIINGYESKEELKDIAELLGSDYKSDTNNVNDGFPILAWQEEK